MALFSRKKKKDEAVAAPVAASAVQATRSDVSHVLKSPRITEKATMAASMNAYVFDVAPSATKKEISQAVQMYYKVRPQKVRVVTIPSKSVRNMRTGQRGVKHGGKKAYVYLKKGESITLT